MIANLTIWFRLFFFIILNAILFWGNSIKHFLFFAQLQTNRAFCRDKLAYNMIGPIRTRLQANLFRKIHIHLMLLVFVQIIRTDNLSVFFIKNIIECFLHDFFLLFFLADLETRNSNILIFKIISRSIILSNEWYELFEFPTKQDCSPLSLNFDNKYVDYIHDGLLVADIILRLFQLAWLLLVIFQTWSFYYFGFLICAVSCCIVAILFFLMSIHLFLFLRYFCLIYPQKR